MTVIDGELREEINGKLEQWRQALEAYEILFKNKKDRVQRM